MQEFLTTLGVGIGVVVFVAGAVLVVSRIGAFAIGLMVAPGTPPSDFKTQMTIGIVTLMGLGILWFIGKWFREVRRGLGGTYAERG